MSPASPNVSGRIAGEREALGGGAWRLLFFMVFVFLVFLISYFGLVYGYKNFVQAQIEKQDQELSRLAAEVPREEQDEFLKFQFQLINLQNLLNNHVNASKVLSFVETNTNSQVYYANLNLDVGETRLTLRGVAPAYEVMAEQLLAFERLPEVTGLRTSSARIIEGGRVQFDAILFLAPSALK